MLIIEEIRLSIAGRLGSEYTSNPNKIIFDLVSKGSVLVAGRISVETGQTISSVYSAASAVGTSTGWS